MLRALSDHDVFLNPVFVSLMAMTLLKETMTPIQLLGGGLIVLAGIAVEKLKI